ncbi:MAG: tRNA lysidine(34) synthetase TilS, partial [Hyphomicrobiales bacterium]|nr:tRNA lysidine(34) synthetase TilS [Hyphomicrobiales bacterium]
AGSPAGFTAPFDALAQEPEEIVLRVLLLACEGLALAPARLSRFESAQRRLAAALASRVPLSFTLGGAYWRLARDGSLRVAPEPLRRRGRAPRDIGGANLPNCGEAPELVHAND